MLVSWLKVSNSPFNRSSNSGMLGRWGYIFSATVFNKGVRQLEKEGLDLFGATDLDLARERACASGKHAWGRRSTTNETKQKV